MSRSVPFFLAASLAACAAEPSPAPPPAASGAAPSAVASAPPSASAAREEPPPAPSASAPRPVASPSGSAASHVVCHCCCGGVEPQKVCLYHAKGPSLADVIAEDRLPKPACKPNAGCSMPKRYQYCD